MEGETDLRRWYVAGDLNAERDPMMIGVLVY
jgi:hypothetical protein